MFKFCFPEKQFVIFRSQNKMCFTCLSLHISVNPVIIVSFYAHVLHDLFTLLELLLQCLDTWYPLINCSYCCHCSNSSLQPPAEPWQHLGFPSFFCRSDKCWKLGAVPETGWLFNMPADNHCLGSCTQSAWVSGVQCRVCSQGKSSSYISNLETFDDWASERWIFVNDFIHWWWFMVPDFVLISNSL